MNEERLTKAEMRLDNHDKDFHTIAESLQGINKQMEKTNDLIRDSILKDARIVSRIELLQSTLDSKILSLHEALVRAHNRIDKHDAIINRLVWTVISFVLAGVLGAVVTFK